MRLLVALLLSVGQVSAQQTQPPPLNVSGIYPHLTVFNSDPKRERPAMECGLGAAVPWAGKLWSTTYTSHDLGKGNDKLFAVKADMSLEIRPESVGGTSACRMIHRESRQLFIASYAINEAGKIRVIPRDKLPGRLTAMARHLTDPEHKVIYLTQEGAVYEVDVATLEVTELFKKPLPGWHYKGAWTSHGRLYIAANGEDPAPSPFWKVDYTSNATKFETEKLTWQYLQTPYLPLATPRKKGQTQWRGLSEDMGNLGEWDGKQWRMLSRRQHLDISGPGGLTGAKSDAEQTWALGWDLRSTFIRVSSAADKWTTYRLPKPSYTADGIHGSNTEWPRICDVGEGPRLMFLHNGLYELPVTFRDGNTAGLRQISSALVTITDIAKWNNRLTLSLQQTSVHGIPFLIPGQPHSNFQFLQRHELSGWGSPEARGGVWVEDPVKAGEASDAILIGGYAKRCVHLVNHGKNPLELDLEVDAQGDGRWSPLSSHKLAAGEYLPVILPSNVAAEWLRVQSKQDGVVTAYLDVSSPRTASKGEAKPFSGLSRDPKAGASIRGIVRAGFPSPNLQFLREDGRYFEFDQNLTPKHVEAPAVVSKLTETHAIEAGFSEDAASLLLTRYDGKKFRLPKGPENLRSPEAARGVRECIQERFLANYQGTFYEVPRGGSSPKGLRNMPDFQRMKPVASHDKAIYDFCSWRGLLVLSGVEKDASSDGHVFGNGDAKAWFGAIDDLWKLGKPTGQGGPWMNTAVEANRSSDPYLMAGYDKKTLTLSHGASEAVTFDLEVDFYAADEWHRYQRITVPAGKAHTFEFPSGYAAHWIRCKADKNCKATAQLKYE
jgi:hypothetical protein